MARMTREFSLVLLGAGLLTAGYFLWPEDDPLKKAEEGGGGRGDGSRRRGFVPLLLIRNSPTRTQYRSSTIRGGFGRVGIGSGA
jgi:hypothetical protein